MATFTQDMEERNTSGRLLSRDPTTSSLNTEFDETREDHQNYFLYCHLMSQILSWLILLIAVVGLVGNVAVLWLLRFLMRRNAVLVYIFNLSVADSITLCYFVICEIIEKISPSIFENLLFLYISDIVAMCSTITGLSILSAISIERSLSVMWPIWYHCHRPIHTSAITCGLLWAIALLLSLLEECSCIIEFTQMSDWCVPLDFSIATYLIVLFVLLSASSLALVLRTFCGSHRIRMTRLCVTILLTVLVFLFCGLPLGIYYFLLCWFQNVSSVLPCYYHTLSVFLSCVNCSANPFIYFFIGSFRQRKRQSLKLVLQRALQDTPERDDTGGSPLQETLELSGSRVEQR